MNINEVEKLTGISRPNIRFYEKKGLIKPKRNKDNDYRDYTEDDVKILNQIKLFRLLSFSIDEISEMIKSGRLVNIEEHIQSLQSQIDGLNGSLKICERLKDETKLDSIDTSSYLNEIESLENKGDKFNSFGDDFQALINYKFKKEFEIISDYTLFDEENICKTIEEYAKRKNYDLEFITRGKQPKFYLNGLRYHSYPRTLSVRANYVVCICDEKLEEPQMDSKRKKIIMCLYYTPYIFTILTILSFFAVGAAPIAISLPILIVFLILLVISIVVYNYYKRKPL